MHARRGDAAIPSLFAGEPVAQATTGQPGLLAELEGQAPGGQRSATHLFARFEGPRRWRVACACLAALALVALVLSPVLLPGDRTGPTTGGTGGDGLAQGGPSAGATPMRPAVVLDEPPPARAQVSNPAPGAGTEGVNPLALLGEHGVAQPAPAVRRRPAPRADSDVDLLAALMNHSGRGGAALPLMPAGPTHDAAGAVAPPSAAVHGDDRAGIVTRALATCPAANTEAGLACRQAACTGHWGEHPSCPRPSAPQVGEE